MGFCTTCGRVERDGRGICPKCKRWEQPKYTADPYAGGWGCLDDQQEDGDGSFGVETAADLLNEKDHRIGQLEELLKKRNYSHQEMVRLCDKAREQGYRGEDLSCVVCAATLEGMERVAPACRDCWPTDEQIERWEDAQREAKD